MHPSRWITRPLKRLGQVAASGLRTARNIRPSALANGLGAAVGVAIVAGISHVLAPAHAPSLMLGAICASVADTPSPLQEKLKRIALGWGLSSLAVLAARAADGHTLPGLMVVGCVGFCAAMVTAYGRNVIPVTVSILLALVLSESAVQLSGSSPVVAAMWFSIGGICYALYAAISTPLLMRHTRTTLVQEALLALAAYVRAQSNALQPSERSASQTYAMLIDAQAVLAERIQAARNVVFVSMRSDADRQIAAQLLVGIDIMEATLSTQADLDTLRESALADAPELQALRGLLLIAMTELERLARGVSDAHWQRAAPVADRLPLLQRLTSPPRYGESPLQGALQATADKLEVLFSHIDRLGQVQMEPATGVAVIGSIDLKPFVQRVHYDWDTVRRELHPRSAIFRYAARLSLAMCCGFLVGQVLPAGAHGSWILLTVALVMRASYSVTRQRRYERLAGNILGCIIAGLLLWIAPSWMILLVVFVTVGAAHAFAAQNYLIASVASCVMALLQIQIGGQEEDIFLVMRIVDTAIGGLIAYAFSHVLPHWERQSMTRLLADLHQAQLEGARRTLSFSTSDQDYRLARRRLFDAIAALSAAVTRMLDEPRRAAEDSNARRYSEKLAASYVFAAELASVRVFLRSRANPEDAKLAAALAHARSVVERQLSNSQAPVSAGATVAINSLDADTYEGGGRLARRLRRLIQSATRLNEAARDG